MSQTVPTILLYNLDSTKGSRLRLLCVKQRIRVRAVRPEEYALPVGALCGILSAPSETPEVTEPFSEEMLVMAGFDGAKLNAFLAGMRRERIPAVALKAVLTPTNVGWTGTELKKHLAEEREAVLRGERAHTGGAAE